MVQNNAVLIFFLARLFIPSIHKTHPIYYKNIEKNCSYLPDGLLVWRSLTSPSKIAIGKGSGEPRIIDLCHKQNSGSSNQISERNSYIAICYVIAIYARCARKRGKEEDGWLAKKRITFAAKEATWKLGYEDVRAC